MIHIPKWFAFKTSDTYVPGPDAASHTRVLLSLVNPRRTNCGVLIMPRQLNVSNALLFLLRILPAFETTYISEISIDEWP